MSSFRQSTTAPKLRSTLLIIGIIKYYKKSSLLHGVPIGILLLYKTVFRKLSVDGKDLNWFFFKKIFANANNYKSLVLSKPGIFDEVCHVLTLYGILSTTMAIPFNPLVPMCDQYLATVWRINSKLFRVPSFSNGGALVENLWPPMWNFWSPVEFENYGSYNLACGTLKCWREFFTSTFTGNFAK